MKNKSILESIIIPAFMQDLIISINNKDKIPSDYPKILLKYINEIDVVNAVKDIEEYLNNKQSGKIYTITKEFALNELPSLIDTWFETKKIVNKNSKLFYELELFFENSTFEEISEQLAQELNDSILIVQTPLLLNNKDKSEYRKEIHKRYPKSYVEFVVNEKLI